MAAGPREPGFNPESRNHLEDLLTPELLQAIAVFLDPASLISLMDASGIGRAHLESSSIFWRRLAFRVSADILIRLMNYSGSVRNHLESSDRSFWDRLADKWHLARDSVLRLDDDSPGRTTVAERVVALRNNIREKKCRVWRCGVGNPEPQLVEENGVALEVAPLTTDETAHVHWSWNGYFALPVEYSSSECVVWNTRSEVPVRRLIYLPQATFSDTALWRQYLLSCSKTADISPSNQLEVLRIFDLEGDGSSDGRSVLISVDGSELRNQCYSSILGVLETSAGDAKALVLSRFLRPTILIIGIPEGVLERKIRLPAGGHSYNVSFKRQTHLSCCIVIKCWMPDFPASLTIMATSKTETSARLARLPADENQHHDGEDCDTSVATFPDGTVIYGRSSRRDRAFFIEAFPQFPVDDDARNSNNFGDLELELQEKEEPKAVLTMEDTCCSQIGISRDIVLFNIGNSVRTARYSADPDPKLELLYEIPGVTEFRLSSHRFYVIKYEDERDGFKAVLHDVENGEVLGEKYCRSENGSFHYNETYFMGETGILWWNSAFFSLVKYL